MLLAVSAKFVFCQTDNPRLPLHVEILQTPTLAVAGGEKYIVYELHLTNFYPGAITLEKIEVFGATNSQQPLFEFKDEILTRNLKYIAAETTESRTLGYGRRAVLFAWVKVNKNSPIPSSISHRLTVKIANRTEPLTMLTAPTKIDRAIPIVISPPIRGANWLAGNAPQPEFVTAHNRLLAPLFGCVHFPQRFATDWVKFGEDGKLFRDGIASNENWYGYGEPVLAVADGIVTEITDGVTENTPPEVTTRMTAQTVAGNYILLKIGANRYAVYAHLKPGSIRFKKWQKVKRGEVLAQIGNSGNSTGPHLHFQIVNAPFTIAEGMPFVFDRFEKLGAIDQPLDAYEGGGIWKKGVRKAEWGTNDLPLNGQVVGF